MSLFARRLEHAKKFGDLAKDEEAEKLLKQEIDRLKGEIVRIRQGINRSLQTATVLHSNFCDVVKARQRDNDRLYMLLRMQTTEIQELKDCLSNKNDQVLRLTRMLYTDQVRQTQQTHTIGVLQRQITDLESQALDASNTDNSTQREDLCIVCENRIRTHVFFPCKHFVVCEECNGNLHNPNFPNIFRRCPMCRQSIRRAQPISDIFYGR